MRTRTLLTTPPGREPSSEAPTDGDGAERYSPGFALPAEPRMPSRWQRPVTIALSVLLVVLVLVGVLRVLTAGQNEDPAVGNDRISAPADPPPARGA